MNSSFKYIEYKDMPNFPGYKIGDDGSVWSNRNKKHVWKQRVAVFYKRPKRYFVALYKNGKPYQRTVHSLVMEAFIGPRPDGMEIAHNNGNRIDNRLDNLRYCSHQENEEDKIIHGTLMQGEKNGNSKLTFKLVFSIKFDIKYANMTGRAIANKHGISEGMVSCIKRGIIWKWFNIE